MGLAARHACSVPQKGAAPKWGGKQEKSQRNSQYAQSALLDHIPWRWHRATL